MSRFEVAIIEGSEKQATIDFDSHTIVEGTPENGRYTLCLRSGERLSVSVKDGRILEVA